MLQHEHAGVFLLRFVGQISVLSAFVFACSDSGTSGGGDGDAGTGGNGQDVELDGTLPSGESCARGTERCQCYPNETCDEGLSCRSSRCVERMTSTGATSGDGDGDLGDGDGGTGGAQGDGDTGGTSGHGDGDTGGTPGDGDLGGAAGDGDGDGDGDSGGTGSGGGTSGPVLLHSDFSSGAEGWQLTAEGIFDLAFSSERACFSSDNGGLYAFGWPEDAGDALLLRPGVPYRLSFRAVATQEVGVSLKFGGVVSPYLALHTTSFDLTELWEEYAYDFTLDSGSSNIGLVFEGAIGGPSTICFDDIRLAEQ